MQLQHSHAMNIPGLTQNAAVMLLSNEQLVDLGVAHVVW